MNHIRFLLGATASRRADLLLMQLEVPFVAVSEAAVYARKMKKKVMLKTSPLRPSDMGKIPTELFENVDVLLANEYEAPILLGWKDRFF